MPELKRFYATYQGFEKHLDAVSMPEETNPRTYISTDSLQLLRLPGRERHLPGGTMPNTRGEVFPWRELTPRALKKRVIEPGTLLLRVPQNPPPFLFLGRDAPQHD